MVKKIYMMCGIPRTGKTTWTQSLDENHPAYGKQVVSRDIIRAGLFGQKGCMEFEPQVTRVHDAILLSLLEAGRPVIIDNTNLTYKRRKPFYDLAEKFGYDVEIIRTYSNIEGIYQRGIEEYIEYSVINRMLKNQDIAMIEFYDIPKHKNINITVKDVISEEVNISHYYDRCFNFNQDNPHHKDDLLTHLRKVSALCEHQMTGMFHDIGKVYAKEYDAEKQCHRYFGHERVSSYILGHYIASNKVLEINNEIKSPAIEAFSKEMKQKYWTMLFVVYHHMSRYQEIGKSLFEKIYLFNKATGISCDHVIDKLYELWNADLCSHDDISQDQITALLDKKAELTEGVNEFIKRSERP